MRSVNHFLWLLTIALPCFACSSDLFVDKDSVYSLELGIAHNDGESYKILMDDSTWLCPKSQQLRQEVKDGQRYRVHYDLENKRRSVNALNQFSANVLNLWDVPVIPIKESLDSPFSGQQYQSIDVDRVWSGGGFLNISYNCDIRATNQLHPMQVTLHSLDDKAVYLKLHHFCYPDSTDDSALTPSSCCISIPLNTLPDGLQSRRELHIAIYENDSWQDYCLQL